jgi:hypothetical protein
MLGQIMHPLANSIMLNVRLMVPTQISAWEMRDRQQIMGGGKIRQQPG